MSVWLMRRLTVFCNNVMLALLTSVYFKSVRMNFLILNLSFFFCLFSHLSYLINCCAWDDSVMILMIALHFNHWSAHNSVLCSHESYLNFRSAALRISKMISVRKCKMFMNFNDCDYWHIFVKQHMLSFLFQFI